MLNFGLGVSRCPAWFGFCPAVSGSELHGPCNSLDKAVFQAQTVQHKWDSGREILIEYLLGGMSIALILATMFFSLVAGVSLIGGSLALMDQQLLNKWGLAFVNNWGYRLVNLLDRLIVGPVFAIAGVRTSHWPALTRAKVCIVLGIAAGFLTQVLGDLASRSGP